MQTLPEAIAAFLRPRRAELLLHAELQRLRLRHDGTWQVGGGEPRGGTREASCGAGEPELVGSGGVGVPWGRDVLSGGSLLWSGGAGDPGLPPWFGGSLSSLAAVWGPHRTVWGLWDPWVLSP